MALSLAEKAEMQRLVLASNAAPVWSPAFTRIPNAAASADSQRLRWLGSRVNAGLQTGLRTVLIGEWKRHSGCVPIPNLRSSAWLI